MNLLETQPRPPGGRLGDVAFIDVETAVADGTIRDLAAFREPDRALHTASPAEFAAFTADARFLCGHNIMHHDLKHLAGPVPRIRGKPAIDTLYFSPLLFPKRPYHRLLKDDKLQTEELNNPLNDAK